jgi:hypothetical protein
MTNNGWGVVSKAAVITLLLAIAIGTYVQTAAVLFAVRRFTAPHIPLIETQPTEGHSPVGAAETPRSWRTFFDRTQDPQ